MTEEDRWGQRVDVVWRKRVCEGRGSVEEEVVETDKL